MQKYRGEPRLRFNPPPGWPTPPPDWVPDENWKPDPSWPQVPPGWQLWTAVGTQDDFPANSSPTLTSQRKRLLGVGSGFAAVLVVIILGWISARQIFHSPHPLAIESWQPMPADQTFQPRFDGYYATEVYTYTGGKRSNRSKTPNHLHVVRFYADGSYCSNHHPVDAPLPTAPEIYATAMPGENDVITYCGRWNETGFRIDSARPSSEIIEQIDSGFTTVTFSAIEDTYIRETFEFTPVTVP